MVPAVSLTCSGCRFWHAGYQQCRVRSPVPYADGTTRWPNSLPDDWCGEFYAVPIHKQTGKRVDAVELQWRADDVWDAHLRARNKWFGAQGLAPQAPTCTREIRNAIKSAIVEHDNNWIGAEQREEWKKKSCARAAGIGIFLSPFHCGKNEESIRYLDAWRPWRKRRGEADPVTAFADLYFRKLAGEK